MASSSSLKPFIASYIALLVLLQIAGAIHAEAATITNAAVGSSHLQNINCGGACTARCQLSKRPNLCKRACGTCCARCGCVPPGTYGQFSSCPCYARLKTRDNKPKCP